MLVENDYESWKIRIHRYIRGKPNGKLIWKSIQNGPTPHPMVTDPPPANSTVMPAPRKKLDSEFNDEENKLEMADTQAEIILSQGLPRHIFNILNQTSTAKEIWDNVEMLMQGSGRTLQQRKEDLFDEYERFRAIGNESIHDYFVRFHKLVNDMKITQLEIPTHQMNTKFVNNLPAYWGKYVTNVKQNMDISTTPYVQIYTHLKAYEPHAKKTLKKQEQSTSIVDPLAYVAHTTSAPTLSSPSTPSPQPTAQSPNDALMATMTQIANLLSGFQKQFPPTNNQLRTSSNSRTHATVHDGHIVTEPIQRKAPGNVGNTGARGKKVICYNCRGEGHVARQCKEPKRKMDSQYFKDKALLMEAKEKGDVLDVPTHQMNTKFVNNLPAYWGKYVTNVKQNMDISTTPYVQIYTHLKAYEPHAKKTLKKQEQSTSIVDPLAYVAHTTSAPALSSPSTPSPQPTAQSPNDALMATMTQIANLLSGFQKQFPPTNNQLRTSSNSRTHATVHDGHIVTEPVQRKAPGNVGNTGARGKKVICYNCRGEGHVARQCKEPKRKMDSQYFKDKALLMEAKEKGDVLDAEAEAFLADVECTAPYDQPQALTTTNMFQANHEDAYDSDVDEGPNAAVAFMANLSSTSATNNPVNEVHSNDNQIFDNVDYQLSQEMHQEEHLDSDAETEIDDNTIPYHQYLLDTEAQNVPTEVSADTSDKVSMIAILTDLQTQLDGHAKVNQEKCLEIETLNNELLQCKQEICRLDTHKVKLDLENKVRQEQALVIQRNMHNAELVQENDLLKSTLSGKEKSIAFLQSEKEKILSEKKDLAYSYLDEIVCLKNANKVARDILQRFNMPTETIPMLFKKPKMATADLHKDLLGTRNPGLGYMAKRAQPALYDADTLLHLTHQPVSIWDSEEVLVQQVVSMKKMSEKPGHAYWLPANERASQTSNPNSPVTPFVRKSRPPRNSKANTHSRTAYTEKLSAFTAENTKLKAQVTGKTSSGPSTSETPKVLAPGMYNLGVKPTSGASKTVPKRAPRIIVLCRKKANARKVVQIVLWYLDSGCSRHMTGDRARLINFVEKFIGTVRFGNDEYAAIVGYGDYKMGDTIISRVYYVEGLKHNLFSVGQFCDGGLEVAFRQHSCHIRNYDMVDLLKGSRTTNLYSISLNDMMSASPVCLLTKASSTKSWLWHRRLNHLNFGTLNELARKNLVRGLPMLKYDKDHLCPSCQLGKSKKASHPLKTENTNTEVLHTLHMDLCGPMRTESINGKKYVLVIVDDYTRFGWVRFLRTKDETPQVIEKFIVKTQRALNATVRFVRTDNGTEFVNKTLDGWFESVGISHETSVPRSPQQNGVVERRNRTLMEAARTMLIFAKAPLFLWAEAVATACYTLNRSLVHTLHGFCTVNRLRYNCTDSLFYILLVEILIVCLVFRTIRSKNGEHVWNLILRCSIHTVIIDPHGIRG
ncbi:retrovirus-related pol polyprotein from transposon TNT 1-94 [Tanacetum coccineum]